MYVAKTGIPWPERFGKPNRVWKRCDLWCETSVRERLAAGQRGDAPQALPLWEGHRRGQVGCVIADAAHDGDESRKRVRQMRARCRIKPNPTRKRPKRYDRRRYKHRNLVERFFGAIKRFRRVATRYEKKAQNYLGFVWLAALLTGIS